jgi:outer membrane protein TolC
MVRWTKVLCSLWTCAPPTGTFAQAEENCRITDEPYEEDIATRQEVLDAQTGSSRARVNGNEALNTYNVAIASLERAMGVLQEPEGKES